MPNKFKKQKEKQRDIALERIKELFKQANLRPKYANKYVSLAKRISTRTKTRIPVEFKRRFCKHCNSYLTGTNARIRLNRGKRTYFCKNCNRYTRVPYK